MTGWYASSDEEDYSGAAGPFASRDEAIDAGPVELDLEGSQPFWVGRCVPQAVPPLPAVYVLEYIGERVYEAAPSALFAEDWLFYATGDGRTGPRCLCEPDDLGPCLVDGHNPRVVTLAQKADLQARLDAALAGWFAANPQLRPTWLIAVDVSQHAAPEGGER